MKLTYEVEKYGTISNMMEAYVAEIESRLPSLLNNYARKVYDNTIRNLKDREGYGISEDSIAQNLKLEVGEGFATLYTTSLHGYLRQFGKTADGKTTIHAKDKKLFIALNPALRDRDSFTYEEIREFFTYGLDYVFAESVRIASNPYVAINNPLEGVFNLSSKYSGDTVSMSSDTDRYYESLLDDLIEDVL